MKPKRNGPLDSNKPSVWQGCSVGWLARRSSRSTGRNGKPKSANCTSTSPMCEKISCTRPRTDRISKSHAVVVVEDLQVKNLSKSAKKNVKAKARLEPRHSGRFAVRVAPPVGVQGVVAGRIVDSRSSSEHQPLLPQLRPCISREPQDANENSCVLSAVSQPMQIL